MIRHLRHSHAMLCALTFTPCAIAQVQDEPQPLATPAVTITITGKRLTDAVKQDLAAEQAATPGGLTVIDGDALRQRRSDSLADALRYAPGVWATGSGGDSAFLSIRGSNLDATSFDRNGIKLLQDGLPVTAADGNNHNRVVDPLAARHAVVARGANALAYGASTLGGAIDFITPTARDGAPSELLLSGGSGRDRQGRLTFGTVAGAFDALVTVEGKRSEGWREHSRQQRTGLYANAGWQVDAGVQTRFYATAIDNDQQLPGALTRDQWRSDPNQAATDAVAGDYQYNVRTWRLANKTTWAIDADSSLSAGVSLEGQQLYHPIVYAPPYFTLLIDTEQRTLSASLRYARRQGSHDLVAGLSWGRTRNRGTDFSYEPSGGTTPMTWVDDSASSLDVFALDRWRLAPRWTLVCGAQAVAASRAIDRTDAFSGALRDPAAGYRGINPRLGLLHQLTQQVQLFANLSRLYEVPTLFQLEDDVRGNQQTLDAMRGTVFEVGTRGEQAVGSTRWHWDVAAYWAKLRGEILSRDSPQAPGTSLTTNVDRTIHAGIEAMLGGSLALDDAGAHRIEPLLSLTLNHFRFDGDAVYGNKHLPAAPSHALKGELIWRHASGFYAGPTVDVVGRRWADFSNTYAVQAYRLWGLRAGFTAAQWELWAEARNLADTRHVAELGVRNTAAPDVALLSPGEPRSMHVGARFRF